MGIFLIFNVQRSQVRHEIKQEIKKGVPEHELCRITAGPSNSSLFKWFREDEFSYKDEMYDVVKKEVVDENTTIYYCISDRQETRLFANLNKMVKKAMDSGNQPNQPAQNLFKILKSLYNNSSYKLLKENVLSLEYPIFPNSDYSSPVINILSPPPENFSA
jgi:hypothetical protein